MNVRTIGLVLAGGVLNVALASLAHAVSVPFYFDSIFTIVVTAHLGLPAGIVTAVVSNALLTATGQVLLPFMCCNVLTALIVALFRNRHALTTITQYLWLGLAVGLANGLAGSVLSYILFGGVTEVHGIDRLVMGVIMTGQALVTAVFWAGIVTNLLDKLISVLVAFFLRPLMRSLLQKSLLPGKSEE